MSTLVDERVVELKFDNSNFEKNTRQSLSTIQRLKSALSFNSIDTSPIVYGLEKASHSFSTWEIASITAISNITNRIVNLGIEITKSLSVDNIAAGWEKFSQQTKSTGTIISQLSNIMEKSAAAELTSEYMEKLQWYSDATSYSLTDMTDAISKFIQKGQDMNTSFKASVGIANWAATAGKNAQEAQIAFNALSKVADHVLSRQWTSIQLGTMDTIEFKNAVLEAAVEVGTLTKSAERLDGTIEYVTKKGHEVSAENFTEFFSDEWFDTETLMKVLGKYGYAVEEVMAYQEELNVKTPYEALDAYKIKMEEVAEAAKEEGDSEKLATAEMALFSAKALEAASEARTLEDAINAVKDAVSTGWLTIFQKIIGEYSQATDLFSDFADFLTGIFTAPTNAINESLKAWSALGGREDLFGKIKDENTDEIIDQGALWNITDTVNLFIKTLSDAFKEIFPATKSFKTLTEAFKEFTSKVLASANTHAEDFKNIFKGIFAVFKLGIKILKGVKTALQPVIDAIKGDSGNFIKFLGDIGVMFSDWVERTEIFNKVGKVFAKVLGTIIDTLKEIKLITRIKDAFSGLFEDLQLGSVILDAWKTITSALDSVLDVLLDCIKNIITFVGKYAIPVLAEAIRYLIIFAGIVAGVVVKGITFLIEKIRDLFDYIRGSQPIQDAWKKFVAFLKSIPERLKKLGPFFERLGRAIVNFFKALWNGIKTLGNGIASVFKLQTVGELFAKIGEKIAYGFNKIVEGIKSFVSADFSGSVKDGTKNLSPLQTFFKGLFDLFKGLWEVIKALIPFIGRILSAIGALFTTLANSINKTFNKDVKGGSGINLIYLLQGGIVAFMAKTLYDFVFLFKNITAALADVMYGIAFMFKAKAMKQIASAIKDIAIAMLLFIGAILLISMIPTDRLVKGVTVLGIILAMLTTSMILIAKFMKSTTKVRGFRVTKGMTFKEAIIKRMSKGKETTGFFGIGSFVISMGLAVLAIVAALKIIDSIDPNKVLADTIILVGIMMALAASAGLMNKIANSGRQKYQKGMNGVHGLVGFALSILILTIPLKRLGEMPITTLVKGIAAVSVIGIAYGTMIRIMHGFKARGVSKIAVFAAAMLAMVEPVRLLGELDSVALLKGVTAITVMGLAYGLMTLMGSKMKITSAIAFIGAMAAFGYALNKIVELINSKAIGEMNMASIGKFALIFGILIASVLSVFAGFNKLQGGKTVKKKIASFVTILIALSGIITGMAFILKLLDGVSYGAVLVKMPALLAVTLMTILAASKIASTLSASKKNVKQLAIFTGIAAAILALSYGLAFVAKAVDDVSWDSLFKLPVLMGVMIATTAGLFVLAKAFKITKNLKRSIVAFISIFAMLEVLAYAMTIVAKSLDGIGVEGILGTIGLLLAVFAGVIGIVAISSKFEKQIVKAAKSLILLASAFVLFGVAAVLLGAGMSLLGNNLKTMIGFAIAIVALSAGMMLLGSAAPTMLTVAVVFGVLGASVLAIGAGFFLMVMALQQLFPYLDELAAKSDSITTVISAMVEGVLEGFANALPTFAQKISEAIDILVQNIIAKLMGIFDWIKKLNVKDVMEVIDKLLELLFQIILSALTKLEENIGPITEKVINILIGFIDGLANRMPDIMNSLVNLVLSLIDGFGQAIEDNAEKLRDTILGFCNHLWNAFLNFFGIHSPSKKTEDVGKNIILGIVQGIGKNVIKVINELVKLGTKMLKALLKLPQQLFKLGVSILKGFLNGLLSVVKAVLDFFKSLWDSICSFFGGGSSKAKEDFRDVGRETMLGYKDGLEEGEMDVNKTAKGVVQGVIDELSTKSEIFALIGKEITDKIANGITASSDVIAESVLYAINSLVSDVESEYDSLDDDNDLISKYLDKLVGILEAEMDEHQFTITPVLDLEEVKNGAVAIAAMLGSIGNNTVYTASYSAEKAQSEINAVKAAQNDLASTNTNTEQINTQNGEVYNVTFNVTGPDPKTIVEEVDKLFSHYVSVNRRG